MDSPKARRAPRNKENAAKTNAAASPAPEMHSSASDEDDDAVGSGASDAGESEVGVGGGGAGGGRTRSGRTRSVARQRNAEDVLDFSWDAENIERTVLGKRSLKLRDVDFSDLRDFEHFASGTSSANGAAAGPGLPPPPPPPMGPGIPPPPPPMMNSARLDATLPKNKKTIRLHWRELRLPSTGAAPAAPNAAAAAASNTTIWDRVSSIAVNLDTDKLEHLFENKAADPKLKARGSLCCSLLVSNLKHIFSRAPQLCAPAISIVPYVCTSLYSLQLHVFAYVLFLYVLPACRRLLF